MEDFSVSLNESYRWVTVKSTFDDCGSGISVQENREITVVKSWGLWLLFCATTGLFFIVSVCIMGGLVRNFVRTNSKKKLPPIKKWMEALSMICSVTGTLFFIANFMEEVIAEIFMHHWCPPVKYIKVGLAYTTFSLGYAALWMRQRSLYNWPNMKRLASTNMQILSWVSGILTVALPFLIFGLYLSFCTVAVVPSGCAVVGSKMNLRLFTIGRAISTAVVQSALLIPFVYPLIKYTSSVEETNALLLKPVIVRSLTCASICVGSDILFYGLSAISVINNGILIGTLGQINLVINLLMIVVVFADWKEKMQPFWRRNESVLANVIFSKDRPTLRESLSEV